MLYSLLSLFLAYLMGRLAGKIICGGIHNFFGFILAMIVGIFLSIVADIGCKVLLSQLIGIVWLNSGRIIMQHMLFMAVSVYFGVKHSY